MDLAAELDPDARMDLFRLTALERRIAELLGRPVDLLPEPVEKQRLQAKIDRDRRRAFEARPGGQLGRHHRDAERIAGHIAGYRSGGVRA